MLYATQIHVVKIWSYFALTDAVEQNIIYGHLESDPPEPIVWKI